MIEVTTKDEYSDTSSSHQICGPKGQLLAKVETKYLEESNETVIVVYSTAREVLGQRTTLLKDFDEKTIRSIAMYVASSVLADHGGPTICWYPAR